jgi:hypothetical protein
VGYPFTWVGNTGGGRGGGGGSGPRTEGWNADAGDYGTEPEPQKKPNELRIHRNPIPVVYGRRQVEGQLVYSKGSGPSLYCVYILCEGEVENIEDIRINGKQGIPSVGAIEIHKGSLTQGVSSLLQGLDPTWTYRLAGTAYVCVRITKIENEGGGDEGGGGGSPNEDDITDIPTLTAIVKGMRVYDPRVSATIYSTNPALILCDLLTNTRYGLSVPSSKIDWDSVKDAADYCDDIIGSNKRYEFNYIFNNSITLEGALEIVKLHFIGALLFDGKYYIEYGRPKATVASFTESEVWNLSLRRPNSDERFNRIIFTWTKPLTDSGLTEDIEWETVESSIEHPNLIANNEELREVSYDLTGCLSLSVARRIAYYLLNQNMNDLEVSFTTYNAKGLQPTDIFSLTHSRGLSDKLFMAIRVDPQSDESVEIAGIEYDPAVYSESIVTEPTFPDTNLPHPSDAPDEISNLQLSEQLTQLKDATWASVIQITWNHSPFLFAKYYEVYLKQGSGNYQFLGTSQTNQFTSPIVKELYTYTVKVITVSAWGIRSAGVTSQIVIEGKNTPPVWKSGAALNGIEAGGMVFLNWQMSDNSPPAQDIDIIGYELRRGQVSDNWNTALFVTLVDTLAYTDNNAPVGTWRYFLKAKDSVGQYTSTALTKDIVVTANPNLGFTQDQDADIDGATVSNVNVERVMTDGIARDWAYPSQGLTWTQRFDTTKAWNDATQTYPLSSYPIWNQPAPVDPTTMTLLSNAVDMGVQISGRWSLYFTSQLIDSGATVTRKVLVSSDDVNYTEYDASVTFNASGRYFKVKFIFNSTSDKSYYIIKERIYVNIQANPLEEEGEASVPAGASQPLSIAFSVSFNAIKDGYPQLTPIGSTALIPVADNISTSGFDLYLFDHNNNKVSGTVQWKVKGY